MILLVHYSKLATALYIPQYVCLLQIDFAFQNQQETW